jgi:hypothetical protein
MHARAPGSLGRECVKSVERPYLVSYALFSFTRARCRHSCWARGDTVVGSLDAQRPSKTRWDLELLAGTKLQSRNGRHDPRVQNSVISAHATNTRVGSIFLGVFCGGGLRIGVARNWWPATAGESGGLVSSTKIFAPTCFAAFRLFLQAFVSRFEVASHPISHEPSVQPFPVPGYPTTPTSLRPSAIIC